MAWRIALVLLAGVLACPQGAAAQGTFRYPSGTGQALRYYAYPLPTGRGFEAPPLRSPYQPAPRAFEAGSADPDEGAFGRAGIYRTWCVRLCDGFYYPISSATGSAGLSHDADVCTAGCGTEARLFYQSSGTGGSDSMVDLTGLGYSALPNAFKYRKVLVPDCRCRPQPWSETELQRHRSYAADKSGVSTVTAPDEVGPAQRPEPVGRDGIVDTSGPAGARSARPARSTYVAPGR